MGADLLPVGIYARQSVDKKDSISIETQIEFCKRKFDPKTQFEVFMECADILEPTVYRGRNLA